MASIDLKNAYNSVPVTSTHQKYLKFEWNNVLYKYLLSQWACLSPQKIYQETVYATLRKLGHQSSAYIDDIWLIGFDWDSCARNVIETILLLDSLRCAPSQICIWAYPATRMPGIHLRLCFNTVSSQVLKNIQKERATVLVPKWPTQPRKPKLMQMVIQPHLQLPMDKTTLFLPSEPDIVHPLHKILRLILCHLPGDICKARTFQKQLPPLLNNPGGRAQTSSAPLTYKIQDTILFCHQG